MTNGTVGQMDRGQRYNESARWLATMARDLEAAANARPVNVEEVAKLVQHIDGEAGNLKTLGDGLTWCESCGQPQESVDDNQMCGECAGEANRNRRALSRS